MNLNEYQKLTGKTNIVPRENLEQYLISGLAAEVGEVCDCYAKYWRGDYDEEYLSGLLKKEIGDVMWFISEICNLEGFNLDGILEANLKKLRDRAERGVLKGSGNDR